MTYEYNPFGLGADQPEASYAGGIIEPFGTSYESEGYETGEAKTTAVGPTGTEQETVFTPVVGTSIFTGPPTSSSASAANITSLQNFMVQSGCPLARYGVDGLWGSETRGQVECAARAIGSMDALNQQFPFLAGLMARPTTTVAPATASIVPGVVPTVSRETPWYGQWWFLLGAAGVLGLGAVGIIAVMRKDEDEEMDEFFEMAEIKPRYGYGR